MRDCAGMRGAGQLNDQLTSEAQRGWQSATPRHTSHTYMPAIILTSFVMLAPAPILGVSGMQTGGERDGKNVPPSTRFSSLQREKNLDNSGKRSL